MDTLTPMLITLVSSVCRIIAEKLGKRDTNPNIYINGQKVHIHVHYH
ncbi:hypothetical protein [Ferrimonas sp.]